MRILQRLLIICLVFFISLACFSQTQNNNHLNNNKTNGFNIETANKSFDEINIKLSTQNLRLPDLKTSVDTLETLQAKAKDCVANSEKQLKEVNALLKNVPVSALTAKQKVGFRDLQEKKNLFTQRVAACRLFVYRSQQALVAYKDTIQKLSATRILKRNTPIWRVFDKSALTLNNIDLHKLYELSGINDFDMTKLSVWLILLALSLGIAAYIRASCEWWLNKHQSSPSFSADFLAALKSYVYPIILLLTSNIYLASVFYDIKPSPGLEIISYAMSAYVLALFIMKLVFKPFSHEDNWLHLPPALNRSFYIRLILLSTLLLAGYILLVVFREQTFSTTVNEIIRTLYITVFSLFVIWFCWLFTLIPWTKKFGKPFNVFLKSILILLLLIIITTEWVGFHQLAIFLVTSIFYTALLLGATQIIFRFIDSGHRCLENPKYQASQIVHRYLGVKAHRKLVDLTVIRISLYFIILTAFVIALLKIWGMPVNHIDFLSSSLIDGFEFFGIKIIPSRIVVALLAFSFVHIIGRLIGAYVARSHQFKGEQDTQVAMASITNYIGFAVAFLIALLIAGVSFTGLAIVAGALSVGIGLGLQNIVNNFFSGVILLLEKQIKPGDRVIIGDTEGFVKKVRIRSTQIRTLAKEDVIVPNADLISDKVVNYMFRDRLWRITCRVGVQYGSDIEKVREVLLQVAAAHPDVLQDEPNLPIVHFTEFADSSLNFDLWCVIKDVNKKFQIKTDLNFAIDKAFREANITIAFPQRDLHIKEWHAPATEKPAKQ